MGMTEGSGSGKVPTGWILFFLAVGAVICAFAANSGETIPFK